jgi:predicted DCC family thiol-disulfide oxidoreductase YuxK
MTKFTLKIEADADYRSIVDNNVSIEVYYRTLSKLRLLLATDAYTVALKNRGFSVFKRFLYKMSAMRSYQSSLRDRQKIVKEMFK